MGIFKETGFIYRIFNFIANLMIINFCFIFGSLGILTVGTGLISAYHVVLKMIDKEEGNILKEFFKAYKLNLFQGIILSIISFLGNLSLGLYLFMFDSKVIIVFAMIIIILFNNIISLAFALLSNFDNTILNTLKNAFLLFFIHIKRTAMILILTVLIIYLSLYSIQTLFISIGFFLLIGFGLIIYLNGLFYKPIIEQYKS